MREGAPDGIKASLGDDEWAVNRFAYCGRRSGSASGDVHSVVDHLGTRFQLHDPFQAYGGPWIPPHFSQSTASGK